MFRIEAGTKALFIDFGCNFDLVEVGLLLSRFLLLEHPQMSHSLKSARYLPHSDTSTAGANLLPLLLRLFYGQSRSSIGIFFKSDEKRNV